MKKNYLFIVVIIILSSLKVFGQAPGPKWEKVFESSDRTIYVDTSSIKQFENQISVLSITYYKTPEIITSLNKEAGSIKSQLLFNAASKKFTVIGTLYYDKNLKILGETSLPGFASSSETFSVSIEDNESMSAVFNKAVEYLKSGLTNIEQKDFSKSGEMNKELLVTDQKKNPKVETAKPVGNDSTKALERVSLYLSKRDSVQKASVQATQLKAKVSETSGEIPRIKKEVKQSPVIEKKKPSVDTKEIELETNPKSTIFKVGLKYSFQVSSWKNRAKAESEVIKLKRKGHTAFLAEGSLNGQTRYRVRIGYFNSLEETEQYMKKLK
jgi:cell division septation protein DedD